MLPLALRPARGLICAIVEEGNEPLDGSLVALGAPNVIPPDYDPLLP